jgi:photosystem II stability/assembly factor-like uncharacterized protein
MIANMQNKFLGFFLILTLSSPFIVYGQWTQTNLSSTSHIEQFVAHNNTMYVATYGDGIYKTTDNGAGWTQLVTGLTNRTTTSLVVIDTLMFTGAWPGGVYRSTNSGGNWSPVNGGLTNTSIQSLYAINDSSTGTLILLAGTYGGGIFRTTNRGQNWGPANAGLTNLTVYAFTMLGQSLFAGTDSGAFISSDSGKTWSFAGLHENVVRRFALADSTMYVASAGNGGVFRSTDQGVTWVRIDSTLSNKNVWDVAVNGTALLAGTIGGGVFRSTDTGTSWGDFTNGITSMNVQSFGVTPDGNYIFGGTDHVGVWRRPVSELTTDIRDESGINVATGFLLQQNYPNPFNPTTTISFQLTKTSKVSLKVFDVLGKEVATLVTGTQAPGNHHITWDASNVASGMYYYRLAVGNAVQVRTMMLIK